MTTPSKSNAEQRIEELEARVQTLQEENRRLLEVRWSDPERDDSRNSSEQWPTLLHHIPMGIHIYRFYPEQSGPGRLVFTGANPAADRLLGVDNSIFIGKTIEEAFPPLAQTEVPERYRLAATNGEPWITEQINYDGKKISGAFEVHAFQIAPCEMVAMFLNVTARKRAELQLRDNQFRLSQLTEILDRSMDFISRSTPDEQLNYLNPAGRKMIGWTEDKDISELTIQDAHPDWAFKIVKNEGIPAAIERGYWRGETALKGPDGNAIPTDQTIFGHSDPETGELVFLSTIIRDISDIRRKEQEIQRLQNFLSNIVDSMTSEIVAVDNDGNITHWNREAEIQSGFSAEKVLGQPLHKISPAISKHDHLIWEAMRTGKPQSLLRQKVVDKGADFFIDVVVFPLTDAGAVVRVDNVTERVKVEELLIQSEKMKSVGELAAGMAHEINNPLSGILQNAQVLESRIAADSPRCRKTAKRYGLSEDSLQAFLLELRVVEMLQHIQDAGKRASSIIRNMLDFSRSGDSEVSPRDIVALVSNALALVKNDYDLNADYDFRKIHFSIHAEKSIPQIMCESGKIQQVLLNVLINSAHAIVAKTYAPGERPAVNISIREMHDDNRVEIAITDNGVGMNVETSRRIFEPFFTTKPVGKGTGLGLSVAYYIVVDEHRGHMSVDSTPGEGTTFRIQLPVRTL